MDIYKEYRTLIEDLKKTCWGEDANAVDIERGKAANAIMELLNCINDVNNRTHWTDKDLADAQAAQQRVSDYILQNVIVHRTPTGLFLEWDPEEKPMLELDWTMLASIPVHAQVPLCEISTDERQAKRDDEQ